MSGVAPYIVRCDCAIDVDPVTYQTYEEARITAERRVIHHACPCEVVDASGTAVLRLGERQDGETGRGYPPSTYAILALCEGQPGAWGQVVRLTLVRAGLIFPGLLVWNWFRPRERRAGFLGLVAGALFVSTSASVGLYGYYRLRQGRRRTADAPSMVREA